MEPPPLARGGPCLALTRHCRRQASSPGGGGDDATDTRGFHLDPSLRKLSIIPRNLAQNTLQYQKYKELCITVTTAHFITSQKRRHSLHEGESINGLPPAGPGLRRPAALLSAPPRRPPSTLGLRRAPQPSPATPRFRGRGAARRSAAAARKEAGWRAAARGECFTVQKRKAQLLSCGTWHGWRLAATEAAATVPTRGAGIVAAAPAAAAGPAGSCMDARRNTRGGACRAGRDGGRRRRAPRPPSEQIL